jgi:hypothetical protein
MPVVSGTRVTPEEAAQLMELQRVRQETEMAVRRAQIAHETAVLDYAECEARMIRKYKLNKDDTIDATGLIVRAPKG